jgi:5'-nucleotidase
MDRKQFIRNTVLTAGGIWCARWSAIASPDAYATQRLTILHTNDVHSRLVAFPMDGGRNQGLGGVAARAALIKKIRATEEHVLLLDAGDIFQGTPYFNIYKGEPEVKAMALMGYDACTMGNHDFDAGMENFSTQMKKADFPFLLCNYEVKNTPLEYGCKPYTVIRKGKLKIGITGVGIELSGLVPDSLYGQTVYLDPVKHLNETAAILKKREKCDMVICLSHLGYSYKDNKISDQVLAAETESVDLIIGGHTHTFMDKPEVKKNKKGDDVVINQVGWAGIQLGRLDFEFTGKSRKSLAGSHSLTIGEKTGE